MAWIGWFMVPAAFQFIYYQKDETGRSARIAGAVLYSFWSVVFLLCLFTDLVEPGEVSLMPFVDRSGPLEVPFRALGIRHGRLDHGRGQPAPETRHGDHQDALRLLFLRQRDLRRRRRPCRRPAPALRQHACRPGPCVLFHPSLGRRHLLCRHPPPALRLPPGPVPRPSDSCFLCGSGDRDATSPCSTLFEPSLEAPAAIFVSVSIIGFAVFGIQFNRRLWTWLQRAFTQRRAYDYQEVLRKSIRAISTILDLDELLAFIISILKEEPAGGKHLPLPALAGRPLHAPPGIRCPGPRRGELVPLRRPCPAAPGIGRRRDPGGARGGKPRGGGRRSSSGICATSMPPPSSRSSTRTSCWAC